VKPTGVLRRRAHQLRLALLDKGLLKERSSSLHHGVLGGIRATTENLALQARKREGPHLEVIGISHEQWRIWPRRCRWAKRARRTGDNFYLDSADRRWPVQWELVAKAVRMARDMGREPASVAQAREIPFPGQGVVIAAAATLDTPRNAPIQRRH